MPTTLLYKLLGSLVVALAIFGVDWYSGYSPQHGDHHVRTTRS